MRIIRIATAADLSTIEQLAKTTWPISYKEMISKDQINYMLQQMYSQQALSSQMNEQQHQFLLAEIDGKPVAFASYSINSLKAGTCRLHKLYVLPELQKTGTGLQLLNEVERFAKLDNQNNMVLNVNRNNDAADFYKKANYEVTKEEDINIGGGYEMNDYVMEKKL